MLLVTVEYSNQDLIQLRSLPEMDEDEPCIALIRNYHELNSAVIDQLPAQPSPLEFMRYVAKNIPFVVLGGAKDWLAIQNWNAEYLRHSMRGKNVRVALTPSGNADAVVQDEQGRLVFAEPHELVEPFDQFLDYIQEDAVVGESQGRNVKYAQPQNDSLREEYPTLFPDVPSSIPFASEALEKDCDAINFWLGNDRSTTSLHKDNYENIYVQIRGQKNFTLLPPVEMPCVNETPLPFARYYPSAKDAQKLEIHLNSEGGPVPVPTWDPDNPAERPSEHSKYSRPIRITLDEGDMLYLPAMWYHKVGQTNGIEGFVCSVNYWYDMDFGGNFWTAHAFLRDVHNATLKAVPYPNLEVARSD